MNGAVLALHIKSESTSFEYTGTPEIRELVFNAPPLGNDHVSRRGGLSYTEFVAACLYAGERFGTLYSTMIMTLIIDSSRISYADITVYHNLLSTRLPFFLN